MSTTREKEGMGPKEKEQGQRSIESGNPDRQYSTANGDGLKSHYASADDLLAAAPKDIVEKDVEDVFDGQVVRIRGLTASMAAQVKQESLTMGGRGASVSWARMEIMQFELGVIEPKLEHEQVLMLHRMSGPSFARVIEALDDISGIGKEELRKAQKDFQE